MFIPEKKLQQFVEAACDADASDIHFVVGVHNCQIKFRKDQRLIDYDVLPLHHYTKLLHYIKYRSHLNLNQAKGPQSSAFNLIVRGQEIRIRVSSIYTKRYESLVLRINTGHLFDRFDDLFHIKSQGDKLIQSVNGWPGLVLITGPTGAGKTTLAYALLKKLRELGLAIVCIEDPVEHYHYDYIQLEINESAGVGYDVSVKEVLRHDPDIIFIGEIRSEISAKAAIRASLTSHLVISTLHAKSALQAFYRLKELGISLIELEQVLSVVTNQRLGIGRKGKKAVLEILDRPSIEQAINAIKNDKAFNYPRLQAIAESINVRLLKG